jgi:hypothetical protein
MRRRHVARGEEREVTLDQRLAAPIPREEDGTAKS